MKVLFSQYPCRNTIKSVIWTMWEGDFFFQMWSPSNYAYYINSIYPLVVAALVYVIIVPLCTYFCKNIWVRTPTPPFNTTLIEIEHNTVVYKKVHYTYKAPIHIHNTPSCGITLMWPPPLFFILLFTCLEKKVCETPPPPPTFRCPAILKCWLLQILLAKS